MTKIDQEVAVLFVLIGWAKAYDGKHRLIGNHRHFHEGGSGHTESAAFLKKAGKYSCGVGRGRLNESTLDVFFVARKPETDSYEIVGLYRNAKPATEASIWSVISAKKVVVFKVGQRPECPVWLKGQGMRRWARRVNSEGNVHKNLRDFAKKLNLGQSNSGEIRALNATQNVADDSDEHEFPEGRKVGRKHISRERNQALIKDTKRKFLEQNGKLYCQVCGFDFKEKYGVLGDGYIEAHHTVPVSELKDGSKTKLSDMAVVCSNCHRMLHRKRPWLSLKDLKDLLYDDPLLDFR